MLLKMEDHLGEMMMLSVLAKVEEWLSKITIDKVETKEDAKKYDSLKLLLSSGYKCFTPEQVLQDQNQQLGTISKDLGVSLANARILLRYFKWNTGWRLMNTFHRKAYTRLFRCIIEEIPN
jgi:hypothetical protein